MRPYLYSQAEIKDIRFYFRSASMASITFPAPCRCHGWVAEDKPVDRTFSSLCPARARVRLVAAVDTQFAGHVATDAPHHHLVHLALSLEHCAARAAAMSSEMAALSSTFHFKSAHSAPSTAPFPSIPMGQPWATMISCRLCHHSFRSVHISLFDQIRLLDSNLTTTWPHIKDHQRPRRRCLINHQDTIHLDRVQRNRISPGLCDIFAEWA